METPGARGTHGPPGPPGPPRSPGLPRSPGSPESPGGPRTPDARRTAGTLGLDLDATLIHGALGTVIADLGAQVAREQGVTGIHDAVMAEARRLLLVDPAAAYDWQAILAQQCAARGARVPFDLVERLEEVAPERTRLLEEAAPEILTGLATAGWRLVALTNGWRRYQVPALRAVGLLDLLDELITADAAGAPKPDPRIFAFAQQGSGPHVHVGDRLDDDVLGAHTAGWQAILFCPSAPESLRGVVTPTAGTGADAVDDLLADLSTRQSARVDPEDPRVRPDAIIGSLRELPALLENPAPAAGPAHAAPSLRSSADPSAPSPGAPAATPPSPPRST